MTNSKRIMWLDWMKVIGMFFIIWGHLFPDGCVPFIYSFSVPLFFVISGFLTNPYQDLARGGVNKLVKGLIIPYFLIVLTNIALYAFMAKSIPIDLPEKLIGALFGVQSYIGAMWFVYTLILMKAVVLVSNRLLHTPKSLWIALSVICLCSIVGLVYWNALDYEQMTANIREIYPDFQILYKGKITWAYSNFMCAFPFFFIGMGLRRYKEKLDILSEVIKNKTLVSALTATIMTVVLFFLSNYNGSLWLYLNEYGNNLILCYLNAAIGVVIIYIVSSIAKELFTSVVTLLSVGNIIVLGFHGIPLNLTMLKCSGITTLGGTIPGTFAYALCLYLCFIPLIIATKKYASIFLGGKK